jgi:hypothetical protein
MMKAKNFIYCGFLFFLVFFLSACTLFGEKGTSKTDWQNEVLMAQACGEEGLMCCINKDPICNYGDCCFDPNNLSNNYCSENCDFGKLNTFCGPGNTCDSGLACQNSYCVECGGIDQPCCGDKKCGDDLACFRGTCVECGKTNNPCCLSEPFCALGGSTGLDRAECQQEICTECGANGRAACVEAPFCNEGHLLNNGICYRCGGFNQPCCLKTSYEGTTKYCLEEGLACKLDFCSR